MKVGYTKLAVPVIALAALIGAPAAAAEERSCRGTLGAVTVDNLRVPQGATCTLNGTRVKGTIKVQRRATLNATNVRVVGNVQAENHKHVDGDGLPHRRQHPGRAGRQLDRDWEQGRRRTSSTSRTGARS